MGVADFLGTVDFLTHPPRIVRETVFQTCFGRPGVVRTERKDDPLSDRYRKRAAP
jgi:hypothetical protein